MKPLLPLVLVGAISLAAFSSISSAPQSRVIPPGSFDSMGLAWSSAVSETIECAGGSTPTLIAEAPSNESLVIRQIWTDHNKITVRVEDVSKGTDLVLFDPDTLEDTVSQVTSEENTGWRGAYVLSPGDKLWAEVNDSSPRNIHWTGFYLP